MNERDHPRVGALDRGLPCRFTTILSTDLDRSERFYEALGFVRHPRSGSGMLWYDRPPRGVLVVADSAAIEALLGFEAGRRPGSRVHDPILPAEGGSTRFRRGSNRAGGLEGGLTTGEDLVLRAAMKPIPSLRQGMPSVDMESGEARDATYQRSDVTSVPAASVVAEAVVALALAEAFLDKYGGDSFEQVRASWDHHRGQLRDL